MYVAFVCSFPIISSLWLYSVLASGDFFVFADKLITFANNLHQNQDRQIFGPDLDPNCLTLL